MILHPRLQSLADMAKMNIPSQSFICACKAHLLHKTVAYDFLKIKTKLLKRFEKAMITV